MRRMIDHAVSVEQRVVQKCDAPQHSRYQQPVPVVLPPVFRLAEQRQQRDAQ